MYFTPGRFRDLHCGSLSIDPFPVRPPSGDGNAVLFRGGGGIRYLLRAVLEKLVNPMGTAKHRREVDEMRNILTRLFVFAATLLTAVPAFAMEEAASGGNTRGTIAIATAISIAVAAFGGALGQGNAVNAAMQGIARNPSAAGKIMTNMIIGLALIESLVIYGLVIAFMLLGKMG